MTRIRFSEADHARITAAVAQAERGTNGEIVTIVTDASDAYHDVPLHFAVAAMLVVAGIAAWLPHWFGDWGDMHLGAVLLRVMIAQAVVFLLVRYGLEWTPLKMAMTPRATRSRRVRRRAVQYFKASAEQRTAQRVGILLYVSLAEHVAEIVADEAIHAKVPPERWGDAMAALVDGLRAGDAGGGMAAAVAAIGAILSETFPKSEDDVNELPDRLIEL